MIYASHVLEHAHYGEVGPGGGGGGDGDGVGETLEEWSRLLVMGGEIMVSVPDMDVLAELWANGGLRSDEKFHLMRMMFGGQTDEKDAHLVGFDESILVEFLSAAGFCRIRRVEGFGGVVGADTSSMVWKGKKISLNVVANKC